MSALLYPFINELSGSSSSSSVSSGWASSAGGAPDSLGLASPGWQSTIPAGAEPINVIAGQLRDVHSLIGPAKPAELVQAWDMLTQAGRQGEAVQSQVESILADNSIGIKDRLSDAGQATNITPDPALAGVKVDGADLAKVGSSCPEKKDCVPPTPKAGCDKKKFFALYCEFKALADAFDTDVYFLMAQASRESGWAEKVENNNLFGVNKTPAEQKRDSYVGADGKTYGTNKEYDSFQDSINAWGKNFGESIRGTKTINEYIDALQGRTPPYNPRGEAYVQEVLSSYCSFMGRIEACGLPPSTPAFKPGSGYSCDGKNLKKASPPANGKPPVKPAPRKK